MGRNWVIENATIQSQIPKLINIYEDLLAGNRIMQYDNYPRWKDEADKVIHCAQNEKSPHRSEFYRYLCKHNILSELGWDVSGLKPEEYFDSRFYVLPGE